MAIPDYETLMLPVLKLAAAAEPNPVATPSAAHSLADQFALSPEERAALLPSGGTLVFASRVSWACTYLKKAGLLEAPRRGFFKITPRGQAVLAEHPQELDNRYLERFQEFRDFRTREKRVDSKATEPAAATTGVPEEVIADQYDLVRKALASQILEAVKGCSPAFFERLVVTVLVRMGYGGSLADAGRAVGRSGDGGIDGVIKEDRLGLDMVYVQAKRWDDKPVGSPQIDQFAGALQKRKAHKGVFMTTSTFTADARRSVAEYTSRIVLIDGAELAELMIDFDVGVAVAATYQIKRLDTDFFSEELADT